MTDYKHEFEQLKINSEKNDKPLPKWYLLIILGILSFGIVWIGMFIIRLNRLNNFIVNRNKYYILVTQFTKDKCNDANQRDLYNLNLQTQSFMSYNPLINPHKTLLFSLLTGGLYFIYYIFMMNKAWSMLQYYECNYDKLLSTIWIESKLIDEPIEYVPTNIPKYRFLNKALFSLVTLGVYLLVWDYQIHIEPDTFFENYHAVSDRTEAVILKNV